MKKHLPKILFIATTLILSLIYVVYIQINGGITYVESRSGLSEVAESLGGIGGFLLALIYARTILKLIVVKKEVWQRLEPFELDLTEIKSWLQKILYYLNKTHIYVGTLAIIAIFMHCYLTGSYLDNLLLKIVLILIAWQGIFGAFLYFKFTPAIIKRKSYLFHAQFITGILILILAAFGHLLIGD